MTIHKTVADQNQEYPCSQLLPHGISQLDSTVWTVGTPFKQRVVTIGATFQFDARHLTVTLSRNDAFTANGNLKTQVYSGLTRLFHCTTCTPHSAKL